MFIHLGFITFVFLLLVTLADELVRPWLIPLPKLHPVKLYMQQKRPCPVTVKRYQWRVTEFRINNLDILRTVYQARNTEREHHQSMECMT